MGPSGSGKTCLLNVLSNRISIAQGSFYEGDIECNGQKIKGDDFSKIGKFVE